MTRPDAETRPDAGATADPPAATAAVLDACRDASARLLATLAGLDDATARRPSRLPDWTVGHVVTHLARNADSHVRMLEGAVAGMVADQYERGLAGRAADIAAGAGRPAPELIADLGQAIDDLDAMWGRVPPEVWATGHGRMGNGELCPCAEMPFRRWREVEIHRVDLGLGPGAGGLARRLCRARAAQGTGPAPGPAVAGGPRGAARLAGGPDRRSAPLAAVVGTPMTAEPGA
jgi:maleylpyruvate isomerase